MIYSPERPTIAARVRKFSSDNSGDFRNLFARAEARPMADLNEPKKETVRITLPPAPDAKPTGEGRDTARINLPARPPSAGTLGPPESAPPSPFQPPLPLPSANEDDRPTSPTSFAPPTVKEGAASAFRPPVQPPLIPTTADRPPELPIVSAMPPNPLPAPAPTNYPGSAVRSSPKKETARIGVLPTASSSSPSVRMAKTQPLIPAPAAANTPVAASVRTVAAPGALDSVPMPLCWALLGVSGFIFLLQIWNYFAL